MKTSYKLAIVAIAVLAVAWCAYTIYKNSQPQPKQAIELNEVKKEIDQNTPEPTETPKQLPTNVQPTNTQKTVTEPVQTPQVAVSAPVQETGGVETPKPATNVTIVLSGTNGQYTALCLAYKNGEAWAQTAQAQQVCK